MKATDGKMRETDVVDTKTLPRIIKSVPSPKTVQFKKQLAKNRHKLTDIWKKSGLEKEDEFALLTNIIHQEWTGLSFTKHKEIKRNYNNCTGFQTLKFKTAESKQVIGK